MSHWFQNIHAIDCDIVLHANGELLRTVQMPIVPRVGDDLDLDLGGKGAGILYHVVAVRHHVRPRRITMRDDLFGVSVFVELTG